MDLIKLSNLVDEALAKETKETINEWLNERRKNNIKECNHKPTKIRNKTIEVCIICGDVWICG